MNPSAVLPIQIAYYAGLRIGEVCGLTWQDINLEEQDFSNPAPPLSPASFYGKTLCTTAAVVVRLCGAARPRPLPKNRMLRNRGQKGWIFKAFQTRFALPFSTRFPPR